VAWAVLLVSLSRKTQEVILSNLMMAGPNVLVFYSDDVAFETLTSLMEAAAKDPSHAMPMELQYHIELINLIADCTEVRHWHGTWRGA